MRVDMYGTALGKLLYPRWERLRGRPTFELLAVLRGKERASLDEQTALRVGLVRRLVRHAYAHTVYYRRAFDAAGLLPGDIETLDDLDAIPLLDRATAQSTVDERTAPWPRVAHENTASGSTDQPLVVRISAESQCWREATRWRGYGWAGYHMGDKAMHLWGMPATKPGPVQRAKQALDQFLRGDIHTDCMARSPQRLHAIVDAIRREQPHVLAGDARALADLARFTNREGLRTWDTIPVIYGAARLSDDDRAELAAAFGPDVFESYACREVMVMGCECEAHDGLHESVENLIVEILVRERDGRVRPARPGEKGEVAVTDLHNLACVFVRYLTGDLAIAGTTAPCACGRTLPRFGPVAAKIVSEGVEPGLAAPTIG